MENLTNVPASVHFIALPTLLETPADLTRRARSLIPSARACASVGGHKLGRWTRGQVGRRDHRYYSARCAPCGRGAYVLAGPGLNQYGGDAVSFRCAARPENVCELSGVEPYSTGPDGATVPCGRPYVALWTYYGSSGRPGGTLRACVEHSRTYRRIAAAVPGFGWRQTGGPSDY